MEFDINNYHSHDEINDYLYDLEGDVVAALVIRSVDNNTHNIKSFHYS